MKVLVDFIDDKFFGKKVDVDEALITKISGGAAMNMLFLAEEDEFSDCNKLVVIFKRGDLDFIPKTTTSAMQVNTFASDKFEWWVASKKYLLDCVSNK